MSNMFDDTINLGFGLFAYSREKIEELVDRMVAKGEVAKKDASSFVSELIQKGEVQRKELKRVVDEQVKSTIETIKPITRDEIRQIIREEIDKTSSKGK